MWIPAQIKAREKDMKAMGLQIPTDRIYNETGTALNNAVVLFGRGCTGEIVSPKGLILTNHHCGYGSVQGLTSADKDYFEHGYWANNMNEELPCKGLTITFIRRMENVTDKILTAVSDTMKDDRRDSIITKRIAAVEKEYATATHLDAMIKPYFEGNQYWVAITETFRDVRLVGFPPNGIGAFGGDVENWMWPRHTGDFSIFRVYAGADNRPADYSAANKPYHTEQFFNISIAGYKEGDFTMVYGFPGTTKEYISSYELKEVYAVTDPISIAARTRKLDVWTKHMHDSRDIFLKYTSKRASVANGWKKWQGEVLGLKANDAMGKKLAYEKGFQQWANKDKTAPFANSLLAEMKSATDAADPLIYQEQYNKEAVLGIELIQQGASLERLIACFRSNLTDSARVDTLRKVIAGMAWFYKNYDAATDRDVFISLMQMYFDNCAETMPEYYKTQFAKHEKNINYWAYDVYKRSMASSAEKLNSFAATAKAADSTKILEDPAWQLFDAINTVRQHRIIPALNAYYYQMHYLDRLYMKAQMVKDKSKIFYPDANLTLRLAYGQVKGMKPEGTAKYSFQTNLGEVVALDDPASDIFRVPKKLKDLYKARDYGRWGVNGEMPVAFLASNHTTGGNSGSPVLNARGELIGTNFDRPYEGTMSDYLFDPERCRNISVDIRYILFIIDKFGGAGWLIDENEHCEKVAMNYAFNNCSSPSLMIYRGEAIAFTY